LAGFGTPVESLTEKLINFLHYNQRNYKTTIFFLFTLNLSLELNSPITEIRFNDIFVYFLLGKSYVFMSHPL